MLHNQLYSGATAPLVVLFLVLHVKNLKFDAWI